MPAINVARTDTFEVQRQKINEIGANLFQISQGGSDLSTGNLKLGDGSVTTPSLAFIDEVGLGIYRPEPNSFGLVSDQKKIIDFSASGVYSYQDSIFRQRVLSTDGLSVNNFGSNYDGGTFTNIPLTGGTGTGGTADFTVSSFVGNVTNAGSGYNEGNYSAIGLVGGTGSGTEMSFTVPGIEGNITNAGSNYIDNTYVGVSLTGSATGSNATATIQVAGNEVTSVTIENSGTGYLNGDVLTGSFSQGYITSYGAITGGSGYTDGLYSFVPLTAQTGTGQDAIADITIVGGAVTQVDVVQFGEGEGFNVGDSLSADLSLNGAGSGAGWSVLVGSTSSGTGFAYTINNSPNTVTDITFDTLGNNYSVGDVLELPDGTLGVSGRLLGNVSGITATLNSASTTVVCSTTVGIVAGQTVDGDISDVGTLQAGTTVISVDSSTEITISQVPQTSGSATLSFSSLGTLNDVSVSSTTGIQLGQVVTVASGTGVLDTDTTVGGINSTTNTITLSTQPLVAGDVTLDFNFTYGNPTTDFQYTISELGQITDITINEGGNGYSVGDQLSVSNTDLVASIDYEVTSLNLSKITFTGSVPSSAFTVGSTAENTSFSTTSQVYIQETSGGNVTAIYVEDLGLVTGDTITDQSSGNGYVVDQVTSELRFFIDTGSGAQITPDLTLFSGNTYSFDLNNVTSDNFSLSAFPGGIYGTSLIEGQTTTLDTNSTTITVSSTTGIVAGMSVTTDGGAGTLLENTLVESVDDSTTLTLSQAPLSSGSANLVFAGVPYTDGVTQDTGNLTIKVTDTTPTLYYFSNSFGSEFENAGGKPGDEAVITIDTNNPKTFGSGLLLTVASIVEQDVITNDIETGNFQAVKVTGTEGDFDSASIDSLTAPSIVGGTASFSTINSSQNLSVTSTNVNLTGNLNVGTNKLSIESTSGDLETLGELKTTNQLNVNDITFINNNTISTAVGNDIIIDPPINRVLKIAATTALQIPAGDEDSKPSTSYDGYIRFNTDTNQYEGYSEATSSWSSLGGVRDLDGNTTILAEETVGANDNTLWFINDNINTVRFSKTHQEFVNAKRIRSVNTSAPAYETWTANTSVSVGDYLRYKTNVYEVVGAGATASGGNEPTDTSGNNFINGSATLRYATTSASVLTFEEISTLRIGENVPLLFDNDLRITKNTISTDVSDITIQPFTEKKVVINATSSLVLPVGDNNQKGSPSQGSVRYNTTDNQFEGFNGAQWGGLGGVKDIDQDTQIKAETAPGQDEDTLYFINANNESLRLTTTRLEFSNIDTIVSTESDTLNVDVSTLTFANQATTLDNSSTTSTFLFTTKDNLDFGLSVGLFNDHLLRLQDSGDIVYNLGFGTGTPNNLTLLNDNLTSFELRDVKVSSNKLTLERGVLNSANATIYSISSEASAKVCLTAHNLTTGDKELVEYYVIDDGTDVYFTDYNNVKSGAELVSVVYDIDPVNNVRLTVNLNTALATGDDVIVTLVKTITKR